MCNWHFYNRADIFSLSGYTVREVLQKFEINRRVCSRRKKNAVTFFCNSRDRGIVRVMALVEYVGTGTVWTVYSIVYSYLCATCFSKHVRFDKCTVRAELQTASQPASTSDALRHLSTGFTICARRVLLVIYTIRIQFICPPNVCSSRQGEH